MLSALLGRNERAVSVPWDTGWGQWPGSTGINVAGVAVTQATASQLMAVYGSASLITDEISTLPVSVDGRSRRPLWVDHPSEELDRIAWLGQIVWSLLMSGNAYLAKIGPVGAISALDPLDPEKVTVERRNGRRFYLVNGEEPRGFDVVHIPGRMRPGALVGMSPVEEARLSIGLGLSAQKFGSEFFENEGNMPGVIEAPGPLQPEQLKSMADSWRRKRRGGGRGLPGVLQAGATWKPTGVTNEQAQFLATRQFTAAEIAGQMVHLDPSDLGIPVTGTSMTYGNLQQRVADRTQKALMPWIRRIEEQLSQLLPSGAEYRFDVDSRLRGNTKESYETLQIAIAAGFMTENEAREVLGMPELPPEALTPPTPGAYQ